MQNFIYEKSLDANLCPNCIEELTYKHSVFNTMEYMGNEVDEIHKVFVCNTCHREYN